MIRSGIINLQFKQRTFYTGLQRSGLYLKEDRKTSYWLDKEDKIVKVCSNWDHFALNNEGEDVLGYKISSKPIWNYISGDISKMWLRALIDLCRLTEKTIERPYRCDSPELRRYLKMKISIEEGNLLRFDHIVERLEDREKPVYFEHATVAGVAFRCSICGQVHLKGKWYEPDDRSALQCQEQGKFIVAYTVCDNCRTSGGQVQICL
jgi:hypothetical protein